MHQIIQMNEMLLADAISREAVERLPAEPRNYGAGLIELTPEEWAVYLAKAQLESTHVTGPIALTQLKRSKDSRH